MKTWRQTSPTGRTLLIAVLFTGLTTFMFLPLLAIQLTAQGIPASRTGFLVGLLAFSSQGFSLLCGLLVDRLGARRVMMAGFALRIIGYLLLSLGGGTQLAPIVTGIVTIGVGGSMLGLSIKTLLVSEDSVEPRTMLALRATFVNIGVVLGPALGAAVYPLGFPFILGACVLSHLVLGLRLVFRPLAAGPRPRPAAGAATDNSAPDTPRWARWQWAPLCLTGVAYWAIYSQLNVVMPITARAMTGSTAAISVVFTVNGALVVLCQYTLLRHVFRRTATRTLLVLGFLAFGCAYAALIPRAGWFSLLLFVLPVTAAEMLVGPSLDEQAIKASSLRGTGRALGTMSAAGACGSLLGASMGGYLLQTLRGGSGVWLVIIGLSAIAAAACLLLPKDRARHASSNVPGGATRTPSRDPRPAAPPGAEPSGAAQ
ncbi:MFS transporter [Streptomyces sp. NPDC020096]